MEKFGATAAQASDGPELRAPAAAFRLLVIAPALATLLTLTIAAGLIFVFALLTLGREEGLNSQCNQAVSELSDELDGPNGEYQGSAGWSLGGSFLEPSCTYSYRGVSGTITLKWGLFPVDRRGPASG